MAETRTADCKESIYPDYLNNTFFKTCLRKKFPDEKVEIDDFELSMATKPGDNYCGSIYRAHINYTEKKSKKKSTSFIVKCIQVNGDRAYLEKFDVYTKEIEAYLGLLPTIYKLLKDSRIAPKCYHATMNPMRTIVFEDLKAQQYFLADRISGLDESHCEAVLRKLAQLHATSMIVLQKEPKFLESFKTGLFSKEAVEHGLCEIFFKNNLKKGAEIVKTLKGFEHFAPKLMTLYENFGRKILESVALDPNDLLVLNHGDLWVNNTMFKYENQIPIDALFIDFQIAYANSPALDLNYFFVTSTQLHILEEKDKFIRNFYYPSFVETLRKIGCDEVPTVQRILEEMRKRELFTLFNLFGELPIISLKKEAAVTNNYADFVNEEIASRTRDAGMSSERFLRAMKYCLKLFEIYKVFD